MFTYGNYIDEVLMRNPLIYYVHDHLYSPVALVWSTGTVIERYEYDAYGEPNILDASYNKRTSSLYANPYYLTGRTFDFLDNGDLALADYRHRSYDTYAGRFLQNDPLGTNPASPEHNRFDILNQYADGVNFYQYVQSNPVTSVDSYGLAACGYTLAEIKLGEGETKSEKVERRIGRSLGILHIALTQKEVDPNEAIIYPLEVDNSPSRKLHAGSKKGCCCKIASCADIQSCVSEVRSENRGYSYIGNNCYSVAARQIGRCCLKTSWRPPIHALHSRCVRWASYAGPGGGVCLEWE